MTDKAKLLALAGEVEKLTGPDRATDSAIFQALNPTFLAVADGRRFYDPETVSRLTAEKYITRGTYCTPNYTASLDAAMTLANDGFGSLISGKYPDGRVGYVAVATHPARAEAEGLTKATAFAAAALRAQAEALA